MGSRDVCPWMAALLDHLHVQPMRWTPDVMIERPAVEASDMASVAHQKAKSRAQLYDAMTPSPHASVRTGARVRVSADSASARWPVDTRAAEETRSRLVVTGADHCAAAVAPPRWT
jgi:hypothetical protein